MAPEGGRPLVADQEGTRAPLPVPAPLSPVGETAFTGWAALEGETHRRASQGAGPASPLVGDLRVWGGSVQKAGVLQLCRRPSSRPSRSPDGLPRAGPRHSRPDPCRRTPRHVEGGTQGGARRFMSVGPAGALHTHTHPNLSFRFCEMGILTSALSNLCVFGQEN